MKWTFGIITNGCQDELLEQGIESVNFEAPDNELIIVGGKDQWNGLYNGDYVFVDFDEAEDTKGVGWITRKKNLIAQYAQHENLCIMHDYVALGNGWINGVENFGYNWKTCMHRILNYDMNRYRDWCIISNDAKMEPPVDNDKPPVRFNGRLLAYNNNMWGRWQYLSGTYFCVKRDVLLAVPFDESRTQNCGEDVQWSRLLFKRFGQSAFSMNTLSYVELLKYKPSVPWQSLPPIKFSYKSFKLSNWEGHLNG